MGRIYISSTFEDLKEQREALHQVLRRQGHDLVCMEDYVARDERPLDRCLADVRGCDLYLGVFAFRYGYIPPGQPAGEARSITELEYREAGKTRKERLCFLVDSKASWPLELVDEDRRAINVLRGELSTEHTLAMFRSTEELCTRALEAVVGWENDTASFRLQERKASASTYPVYSRKIRERYGRVELDTLVPPERDEQLRIPLDAVFIEQRVREDRPPVELPKELWEKLQQAGEVALEDLPRGMTVANLEAARSAFQERPTSPVFDALAGGSGGRVVLLGDPGAGKSTLTRYVLLSLLDAGGDARVRAAYPEALPLMVELRKFAGLRAEGRCETFVDYLAQLGRTEGFCITADALAAHLRSKAPTVMIFDGLDELFDPRLRETVAHQIAGFASDHPHVRQLVTSRIVGYSPKVLADAGFAHFTLQDLPRSEMERFLAAWFGRVLADRSEDAALRQQRILAAVDESHSIRMIAGNPMLLTIMAIIGKNQELPRERAELYQHAATVLVEHWDVKKHLVEADLEIGFDRQEKLELLRRIAWTMQAAPGGLAGNYIQDERLLEAIQAFVEERFGEPVARARRIATVMIRQLRERNFILCLYGAGLYGFVHRSFLEFFCASAIQRKFEKTQELSLEELKRDVYGAHWEDEAWREVLRLVAGLIEPRFAGEVIDYLATEVYADWPKKFGERPPRNLALAAECLGEVRNLLALDEVGERVLRRLIALLEHGNEVVDADRNSSLLKQILPAVESIGERWPGRMPVQSWFWQEAPRLAWYPLSLVWCRMMGALYRSDSGTVPFLCRLARHRDDRLRHAACVALVAGFKQRPETIGAVVDLCRDGKGWAAADGATLLGQEFPDDSRTYDILLDLLRQDMAPSPVLLRVLVQRFSDRDETLDAVLQQLHSKHWVMRAEAVAGIDSLADRPETLEALGDCLRDGQPHHALATVIHALGNSSRPEMVLKLLTSRLRSAADPTVRAAIVEGLARFFRADSASFDMVVDRLERDPDPGVRRAAADDLASFARPEVASALRTAAERDASAEVRDTATVRLLRFSDLGIQHRALLSADLTGSRPFLDLQQPLPAEHLEQARIKLALTESELDQALAEITSVLGWDPRAGLPPN